jgi:hypothetical protein
LVTWATVKSMSAEWMVLSRRATPFFTDEQRHQFRRTGIPPLFTKVWIGRYVGESAGWIMDRRSTFFIRQAVSVETEVYAVTYSIGEVLLQILAVREHEQLRRGPFVIWAPEGPWDEATTEIWPLPREPTKWPPAQAFDSQGFKALAERWHQQDAKRQT